MSKQYTLTPIRSEADYKAALEQVEGYFDAAEEPDPDSPAGAHFEALITLIAAYEAKHYPVSPPNPIEAIRFRMEQAGLTAADLKPYIGGLNRVYEVLNGKRSLSISMIHKLHSGLGVPLESLIGAQ